VSETAVRPSARGATTLLAATIISGIAGYLVTWFAYRLAGPAEYASFAVFWAAIYLVVGALAGVQQEIARATHPLGAGERPGAPTARNFAVMLACGVAILILATAPFWGSLVFPGSMWGFVLPLAIGTASYAVVAVVAGSLYGVHRWNELALMMVADALVRLVAVVIGGLLGLDAQGLAWLIALPFGFVILVLWPVLRRGVVGRIRLDVDMRGLASNVSRTLVASASTALMVSGFPLLISAASDEGHTALLGEVIFATTLVRAPLIVGVMSLQSYLIVRFRADPHARRSMVLFVAVILAGGAVLAVPAVLLGTPVLTLVGGDAPSVEPWFYGVLVVSSALVAALTVTGAELLAASRHLAYSAGWAVAAVATAVSIVVAGGLVEAVAVASLAGPVAGLIVHVVCASAVPQLAGKRDGPRGSVG